MKVENILNATRPEQIPVSKDCLFLFFELSAALIFFRKTAAGNEYWKGGTHIFMPCYEFLVKSCVVRKCIVEPCELKSFTDNFKITNSIERTELYLHTLENLRNNDKQ